MRRPIAIWGTVLATCVLIGVGLGAAPPVLVSTPPTATATTIQPAIAPGPTIAAVAVVAEPTATTTPLPTEVPIPPPATPEPPVTAVPTPALTVQGTEGSGLVLRQLPGGGRVASVDEGQQVADLGEYRLASGRAWQKVRASDGTEGWAAAEFLAGPSGRLAQAPPTQVPTQVPAASPASVVAAATATKQPVAAVPTATARTGATATSLPVGPARTLPYPGNGGGPTVCADGSVSGSSGSGTCSSHDGIAGGSTTPHATAAPSTSSSGAVHVSGYTRKDGTYVRPHTRSAPRRR
jgi:hypothetical protein